MLLQPDDTVVQNIVEVMACPPKKYLDLQFEPQRKAGLIKNWVAYCLPTDFNPKSKKGLGI